MNVTTKFNINNNCRNSTKRVLCVRLFLTLNKMKEIILKFLLENTEVEGRYIGGGDEPQIVIFPESEDWQKEDFLNTIAERLEVLLQDTQADA